MRIAVVGSGPTGFAVCAGLLSVSSEHEIFVYDPGENWTSISPTRRPEYKSTKRQSSHLPFLRHPFGTLVDSVGCKVSPSHTPGGFSTVWGACWKNFVNSEDDFVVKQFLNEELVPTLNTEREISRIGPLFGLMRSTLTDDLITFSPNELAVSVALCESNKTCLTGCSKTAIWNGKKGIQSMVNNGAIYSSGLYLDKVTKTGLTLDLEFLTSEGTRKVISGFDSVFLSTGPIETFAILSRSNLIRGTRELRQTRTFLFAGLYVGSLKSTSRDLNENPLDITLSLLSASFLTKEKLPLVLQFYRYSRNAIEAILPKPLLHVLHAILSRFEERIFFGLTYVDSEASNTINLNFYPQQNLVIANGNRMSIKNMIRLIKTWFRLVTLFARSGILVVPPIPALSVSGKGNHIGGFLTSQEVNINHSFKEVSSLYFGDSSYAPSLPNGSFTLSICSRAYAIARNMVATS